MQFARDLEQSHANRYIGMYVNERTINYGDDGREAIRKLLALGHERGIIPAWKRVSISSAEDAIYSLVAVKRAGIPWYTYPRAQGSIHAHASGQTLALRSGNSREEVRTHGMDA